MNRGPSHLMDCALTPREGELVTEGARGVYFDKFLTHKLMSKGLGSVSPELSRTSIKADCAVTASNIPRVCSHVDQEGMVFD